MIATKFLAEQAIVYPVCGTSPDLQNDLSTSAKISRGLAEVLLQMSPDRNDLILESKEAFRFNQIGTDLYALSRTVIGRVDSNLSEQTAISRIVLLNGEQLAQYGDHVPWIFFVLLTAGHLTIPLSRKPELPSVELPEYSFPGWGKCQSDTSESDLHAITRAVDIHHQIALLGVSDPLSLMSQIFSKTPVESRLKLNFSTGIHIDEEDRYAVQVFPDTHAYRVKKLSDLHRRTFRLDQVQEVAAL